MGDSETRIHLDRLAALSDRFVIGMRKHKKFGQIRVNDQRKWIQVLRFSHFRDRLVIVAEQTEMPSVPVVSGRVARVQCNGSLELYPCGFDVPVKAVQAESKGVMSCAESVV